MWSIIHLHRVKQGKINCILLVGDAYHFVTCAPLHWPYLCWEWSVSIDFESHVGRELIPQDAFCQDCLQVN